MRMSDSVYRSDRETARGHLIELQNELHDRRARLAELTRRVNLLGAPKKKIVEPPRIPHTKLRVQVSAICALFTGYGMQQWMGETNIGRLIGIATTAAVFIIANWFVPWPLRLAKNVEPLENKSRAEADQLALEEERRACEKLESEITDVQRVLGNRVDEIDPRRD
jgi:hypothetical protein